MRACTHALTHVRWARSLMRATVRQMGEASERYKIFIKRLELSDDPAAREYLRATNAKMLEGGLSLQAMIQQ